MMVPMVTLTLPLAHSTTAVHTRAIVGTMWLSYGCSGTHNF